MDQNPIMMSIACSYQASKQASKHPEDPKYLTGIPSCYDLDLEETPEVSSENQKKSRLNYNTSLTPR